MSVILPNYNGAHMDYLSLAVGSILGQDFADFELVVVDDGSTDNSLRLLRKFSDPRCVLPCVCACGSQRWMASHAEDPRCVHTH